MFTFCVRKELRMLFDKSESLLLSLYYKLDGPSLCKC